MRPAIKSTKLTDTLTLSECHDGFWLYDKTRGMNLSMRAKTPTDAFVEALAYHRRRQLRGLVDGFVSTSPKMRRN